jgi:hypothetical protein
MNLAQKQHNVKEFERRLCLKTATSTTSTQDEATHHRQNKTEFLEWSDVQLSPVLLLHCCGSGESLSSLTADPTLAPPPPIVEVNVDSQTLTYLAQYLRHHRGIAPAPILKPIRSCTMSAICPDAWDAVFIDQVLQRSGKLILYELTSVAHDLQVESLLSLCCAKIATLIKNRPYIELRRALHP